MPETFLTEWHRIVAEKDLIALGTVLAEDISMGAPPYWQTLSGRPLVHHLLGLIVNTIEDFTYHREWQQDGELALEFTGHVGDLELQGIDLISLDESGRVIRNLDVLMRPLGTIEALRDIVAPQMAKCLAPLLTYPLRPIRRRATSSGVVSASAPAAGANTWPVNR